MTATVRLAGENHQPFSALWRFEQGQGLAIASGDGFAAVVPVCAGRGDRFFADFDIEILRFV
jgi:hypothetical protein